MCLFHSFCITKKKFNHNYLLHKALRERGIGILKTYWSPPLTQSNRKFIKIGLGTITRQCYCVLFS